MRRLTKVLISVFAVCAMLMSTTGAASADQRAKSGQTTTVKTGDKANKSTTKKEKKSKKKKKAKKNKKGAKSNQGSKSKKRVANFAPVADPSPTELPACDPDIEVCVPEVDPTPIVDPTCDPMIDKLCQEVVDPTCDPTVDEWCQIVVDPEPSDEPTVDPYPTPEPSDVSAAWTVYLDAVSKAQNDFFAYVDAAQKAYDLATADALAQRDADIAAATSFADVVEAVKNYRLATADERAKLDLVYRDANEALSILVQKAWDTLVASGGPIAIPCWDKFDGGIPVATPPAAPKDGKEKKKHKRH